MKIGSIDVHALRECQFRLDGGAMFGHVPKAVWQKQAPTDAQNRIQLACNVMLVRHADYTALVDAGMGTKWPAKEAALYDLEAKGFDELLAPHGLSPADITHVVLSHLHFDHCGGITKLGADGKPALTFPNATIFAQWGEWQAALAPDLRSRPSYRPDDFMPAYEAGRIVFLQGNQQILPGMRGRITMGHTLWHQSIEVADGGERIIFLADLMPTTAHLKPNWPMGYDLYPLGVMESRARMLEELAKPGTWGFFEHDPHHAIGRVSGADGKYAFAPEAAP